jgi:hypothetical protein
MISFSLQMNHWKKIDQMLDEANNFHPNIKLTRQIGTSVSFLDLFIENKNGILTTSVYHKEAAEPYLVPFKSDHPRHVFVNIIDGALMRAICSSSTISAFNEERSSIKLMLLYNGFVYPLSSLLILSIVIFFLQLSAKIHLQSIHEIFYTHHNYIIDYTFHC